MSSGLAWKRWVNVGLRRAAGVEIVAAGTAERARQAQRDVARRSARRVAREARRRAARELKEADRAARAAQREAARQAQEAQRQARASAAPKEKPFPADYDEQAREVIRAVEPWTMTSREKLYALVLAVRHVVRHDIPGDVVECGVWRGGSMQAVARTLLQLGVTDRDLHLFDTFEGMPPPTDEDRHRDGRSAAEILADAQDTAQVWARASLEDVQDGMSRLPYPAQRVHYVRGMVEDTIPRQAPEQISILRLDTDWYTSTKHELEHLYGRLSPGGVLIIDDYGYWQGSRKAVDEFLEATGERLLLLRISSGRIAVKP